MNCINIFLKYLKKTGVFLLLILLNACVEQPIQKPIEHSVSVNFHHKAQKRHHAVMQDSSNDLLNSSRLNDAVPVENLMGVSHG